MRESNQNATGGYLDEQGANELLVRAIGRIQTLEELQSIVIKSRSGRHVLLQQVAHIVEGADVKRGDSAAFVKRSGSNPQPVASPFEGGPAVILTINKQPGADTRQVAQAIREVVQQMKNDLPEDVRIEVGLFDQSRFIDLAIENVIHALRDGSLLVVVVLFLFLLNFRTTFITLTAIPLSIVVTALVFKWFGLSINTMTLGGLAVAMGELVDDAIVGVENVFRRLKENGQLENPQSTLKVVYRASSEVRNPIVFGTMIVVLVFVPLFALSGMEGKIFTPLGVAYIVSLLSSLIVSLTVTPALSYWLLPSSAAVHRSSDSLLLRGLKSMAGPVIQLSMRLAPLVLLAAAAVVALTVLVVSRMERDFLPPFNEGAIQINAILPPGTGLRPSSEIAESVERSLMQVPEIRALIRRTGRAELDEHAEGVNTTEIVATLDANSERSREAIIEDVREALQTVPGINTGVEQPLAHLISHMLSGVKAQIAIKIFGDDLDQLRRWAAEIEHAIGGVPGVKDLQVEPQITVPQLRIEIDPFALSEFGLTRMEVTDLVQTAMNGMVVSEIIDGQKKFDLLVRFDESSREDRDKLRRLAIPLPGGGNTTLDRVADIYEGGGPNTINREQVRRRMVVQCNVAGRGLVDVVEDIKTALRDIEGQLPTGYSIEYGGQFESQQSASRMIAILSIISLLGMLLVLYSLFRSMNLAIQVMVALPMALIGSVIALIVTGQTVTIAAMVGFISLCGIASRNGILLINHYLHLVENEGAQLDRAMIVRAGKQRLAPVLMTALTSGIGLIPLALAAGEPGKEILYPVATVIIGGLITSTLLEFIVRPALFWTFGRGAAKRVIEKKQRDSEI